MQSELCIDALHVQSHIAGLAWRMMMHVIYLPTPAVVQSLSLADIRGTYDFVDGGYLSAHVQNPGPPVGIATTGASDLCRIPPRSSTGTDSFSKRST